MTDENEEGKIKIDLALASKHHAGHGVVAVTENSEYARGG
jgi:hypothetical protein